MIYLIGGPPRCGKSTIARKLSRMLGGAVISGEWLEGIVSRYVVSVAKRQMFPKNTARASVGGSNDKLFAKYALHEIVCMYMEQAEATAPAIDELVARAIRAKTELIIEGYQVTPQLIWRLVNEHGPDDIRAAILYREDNVQTLSDCRSSTSEKDWFHLYTEHPDTHHRIVNMIMLYSDELQKAVRKTGVPTYCMDGGFQNRVDMLVRRYTDEALVDLSLARAKSE